MHKNKPQYTQLILLVTYLTLSFKKKKETVGSSLLLRKKRKCTDHLNKKEGLGMTGFYQLRPSKSKIEMKA
jgi:hypothetical protein